MTGKAGPLSVKNHDARDLGTMLEQWRRGRFEPRPVEDEIPRRPPKWESETVVLLEDLKASRVAMAEKLVLNVGAYTLDIVLLGFPSTSVEDFGLLVNGKDRAGNSYSKEVRVGFYATAQEFQEATGVTGEVTLGSHKMTRGPDEVLLSPSRWRVTWGTKDKAELLTFLDEGTNWFVRIEETMLVGTGGIVETIQTIPTGWDTPLKAGAVCECLKHRGQYYKVIAAEARFWFRDNDIDV